jgi:divalent metal cation (Fe/Co/Zn/Cd) transporter
MTESSSTVRDWTRVGLWLVAGTMGYNLVEAGVALWSGAVAHSIALVGFGLDSIIELAAASVLFWRLRVEASGAEKEIVEAAERRVHRFVGFTFFALAAYVLTVAIWTLVGPGEPEESLVGIFLAIASLVVMPLVAWGKLRAAREIPSSALRAEAKETLACSYLSFALLLGLAANALAGWSWADPAAALLMIPWLVREGWEGVVGEEDEDSGRGGAVSTSASPEGQDAHVLPLGGSGEGGRWPGVRPGCPAGTLPTLSAL